MIKITFKRRAAAEAFASMAEGIWDVHRDECDASFATWDAFTDAFCAQLPATNGQHKGPVTVELDDRFVNIVESVRVNCYDNAHEKGIDDEPDLDAHPDVADDICAPFDLLVERDGQAIELSSSTSSADAIGALIDAVELTGRHEREPRVAEAIKVATMILEQKGCEHFDCACDGSLTSLIDIIVFG
jgi:hypothetical protein